MKIDSLTLLSLLTLAGSANAATVSYAGVINNNSGSEISGWRTPGIAKTLDPDGDNTYGTVARLFYTVIFVGQGSVYQFDGSDAQVGPFPGYSTVNHPVGGPDIQVRTTTQSAAGADDVMFTFTALAGSPANVRIGIATDGLDNSGFSPSSIGLRQVGGASAEHTLTSVNNVLDMVFFDVTGVTAGNQFEVFGDPGAFGFTTHSIVTWDAIPEPSTALFGGFAALGLLRRRRA